MTSVTIYKNMKNEWTLSLVVHPNTKDQFIYKRTFHKLVDAMEAANALKIHINNENVLPLRQYVKAG